MEAYIDATINKFAAITNINKNRHIYLHDNYLFGSDQLYR